MIRFTLGLILGAAAGALTGVLADSLAYGLIAGIGTAICVWLGLDLSDFFTDLF